MLAFEVEYLLGRVFAGDFSDRAASEWPPHPARLFSALVAAHFETGATHEGRAALDWLVKQSPPALRAGVAGEPNWCTPFVPGNFSCGEVHTLRPNHIAGLSWPEPS